MNQGPSCWEMTVLPTKTLHHPCNSNLKLNYRIKGCSHWQLFAKQLEVSFLNAMSDNGHWWCNQLEQSSTCKWADAVTTNKWKNWSSRDPPPNTVGYCSRVGIPTSKQHYRDLAMPLGWTVSCESTVSKHLWGKCLAQHFQWSVQITCLGSSPCPKLKHGPPGVHVFGLL